MHFLIAVNFVRNMPWTPQWWAVVLARGLTERGHRVSVLVDGTECPQVFDGIELRIARPDRIHLGAHPGRFLGLVRRARAEHPGAVLVSLSPMVRGDVWLPVEPAPAAVVRRLVRDLKPLSLALELLHHPWLPFEAWAATRAGAPRGPRFGSDLPRVSVLRDRDVLAAHAAAAGMREALGLSAGGLHAVLPVVEVVPRTLGPLLRELAGYEGPWRVLIPTARPHTVAQLAARAGLTAAVPMGLTASLPAVAAACDVALAGPAAGAAESGGRWVADAMRLGLPVLADERAAGAELVRAWGGGEVVSSWRESLARAAEERWRRAAVLRLAGAAAALSPEALLERLEQLAAGARPAMVEPRGRPSPAEG